MLAVYAASAAAAAIRYIGRRNLDSLLCIACLCQTAKSHAKINFPASVTAGRARTTRPFLFPLKVQVFPPRRKTFLPRPMLRARPRDSRVGGFRPVVVLRRVTKRNAGVLSRSAAYSAGEIQTLFRIRLCVRTCLVGLAMHPEKIVLKLLLLKLLRLRQAICAPMVLNRTVLQPKNRTIQSLEWGDDYIREFFMFNDRHQLRAALTSLRAPTTLKLFGTNTGIVDSEFAFLLYLYRMANRAKLTLMATVFGEDWSVISRALAAFGAWLHDAHSHRLTDAMHFWAQYVSAFNAKIVERGIPLMGDSAYSNGPVVIRVPGGRSHDAARCSAVRVAVEHAFSKIYTKCRSMDWSENARLFAGQRIVEMFYNCALLCNMHTCLNGSQIGNYFNCACPSLDDYMGFARR
jgi:hypothetical protein